MSRILALALLVSCSLIGLADTATAQRTLTSKSFTDSENGYRIKHPKGWTVTPILPQLRAGGLIFQLESLDSDPAWGELSILRLEKNDPSVETSTRRTLSQALSSPPFGLRGFSEREVVVDESLTIKKTPAHHLRWSIPRAWIDSWTMRLPEYDICLVFVVHKEDDFADSWLRLYTKSARTFEQVERTERLDLEDAETYEDVLTYYDTEAQRTPGWRAIPTPSENFVIKTNSDNKRFIDDAIERLERSREIFEQDFPPPEDFDHISVVRLCDKEEEFHQYGGTGGGTVGWFNPRTTELVLYDAVAIDRNMTFAVMSHEAFHQYCYFLFGRSEAHRWFDEGHGDYYGSFKFKGKKATVTAKMPGGLERFSGIKAMIREGTYARLEDHLNFSHRQWQSQGPRNVSPYEQSWSIIYMLRQGSLGKVSKKMWKEEYADILPNYVRILNDEFARAYEDQVDEVWKLADEEDREPTEEELHEASTEVDEVTKQKIWDEAMKGSWGRIDLDEFEENWLLYVSKHLKD